jgi:methyl-accepting chemotaxis protein
MAAIIVATAGIAFFNIHNLSTLRNTTATTHQVLDSIHEIVRAEFETETGQLGYLLSGDESYLALYRAGVDHVHQWLDELDRLTRNNTVQQQGVRVLRPGPRINSRTLRAPSS